MRHTLIWLPSAVDELLSLWVAGPDRNFITATANQIDPTLRQDPILRGETLTRSTRVLLIPPLKVAYRIFEDDRVVQILSIQRAPASDEAHES